MKGFSLIEVLVSLVLTGFIFAGALRFSIYGSRVYRESRMRAQRITSLEMARGEMQRMVSGIENEFWFEFPLDKNLVHETDHNHGATQLTASCPESPAHGCLIIWDLAPSPESAVDYRIELEDLDWPQSMAITPVDDSLPIGPADEIGAGAVLFVVGVSGSFCLVVSDVAGNRIYPAADALTPWTLPATVSLDEATRVVLLGQLEATHTGLGPEPGRGNKLVIQPWRFEDDGWRPGRSRSAYAHLLSLLVKAHDESHPDRILLIAGSESGPELSEPLVIETQTFYREVSCALLEL